jgi:hypothetical protein
VTEITVSTLVSTKITIGECSIQSSTCKKVSVKTAQATASGAELAYTVTVTTVTATQTFNGKIQITCSLASLISTPTTLSSGTKTFELNSGTSNS